MTKHCKDDGKNIKLRDCKKCRHHMHINYIVCPNCGETYLHGGENQETQSDINNYSGSYGIRIADFKIGSDDDNIT